MLYRISVLLRWLLNKIDMARLNLGEGKYTEKVTETNEFEVHDLFCSLYHLQLKNNVENEPTERVEIVVKGYDDENGEHIAGSLEDAKAVEAAIYGLLSHMREVDCIIHDHFEYTC